MQLECRLALLKQHLLQGPLYYLLLTNIPTQLKQYVKTQLCTKVPFWVYSYHLWKAAERLHNHILLKEDKWPQQSVALPSKLNDVLGEYYPVCNKIRLHGKGVSNNKTLFVCVWSIEIKIPGTWHVVFKEGTALKDQWLNQAFFWKTMLSCYAHECPIDSYTVHL